MRADDGIGDLIPKPVGFDIRSKTAKILLMQGIDDYYIMIMVNVIFTSNLSLNVVEEALDGLESIGTALSARGYEPQALYQ